MRGFAISFLTLARALSPDSFLPFSRGIRAAWPRNGIRTVLFRTIAKSFELTSFSNHPKLWELG
jgi:hypothetical protein